ncbi:hypothetical protein JOH50_004736 [Rhizobium leguminosarum]|nr:hypothetical protein [Rhizobium leguminosarum]
MTVKGYAYISASIAAELKLLRLSAFFRAFAAPVPPRPGAFRPQTPEDIFLKG